MCIKTKNMLIKILEETPRDITSLMKLSYLIDLSAIRKLGKKISDFRYIRYNYGPFDAAIYTDLDKLIKDKIICTQSEYTQYGETIIYKLNREKIDDIKIDALNEDEIRLIEDIINSLEGYGAKLLTDIAYKTKPMVEIGATLGGDEHMCEELKLE
jgi:uncharacterized phage-associated protein